MKSLLEYFNNIRLNSQILSEEMNILASETIVTESFKSSILQKLAQKIYDAEKTNNQSEINNKKEQKKRDTESGYTYSDNWYKPKIVSFASVLGPITTTERYSGLKKKFRGIKWSEITNDDFKEYSLDNKELIKLIKKTYGKPEKSVIIVVDKNDNPLNLVKAFNEDPKQDGMFYFKSDEIKTYKYDDGSESTSRIPGGMKELTKPYYSYQHRALKAGEVIDTLKGLSSIEGLKAYALEITKEMTQEYERVILDRKEAQKGVINYDSASLKALARAQKARYETLIKKMREEKLSSNKEQLWKDIENAQKKVVAVMQEAVKPENLQKSSGISMVGDLMRNITYAYQSLLEYYQSNYRSQGNLERAKQRAAERGKDFDEEEYKRNDFDSGDATKEINKVVIYIKDIDKEIDRIHRIWNNED